MRQFARLWRLVEPISDDGCDQYLSLLSKLTAMKGGAGDMVPSADGLQCLVSPVAVRSMLPSSARQSHSIGVSEAQSAITVGELVKTCSSQCPCTGRLVGCGFEQVAERLATRFIQVVLGYTCSPVQVNAAVRDPELEVLL